MDREGAETHLRLLAEAEPRHVMKMPVGSIPGRWYSDKVASCPARSARPILRTYCT
jgi:hypothetical protein